MILERLGYVKTAKSQFFDENSQKSALQLSPLTIILTPTRPQIYVKNQENKVSNPNFSGRFHF